MKLSDAISISPMYRIHRMLWLQNAQAHFMIRDKT